VSDRQIESPRRGPFSPRAIAVGLCCVIFVALFAPYNDYALNNTFFIGNHFPVGVTLLMFAFVLGVNPLIRLIRPGGGLHSTELAGIWAICLIGSAFPTSGLLKYLIPYLITPIYMLPSHQEWLKGQKFLPDALFPTAGSESSPLGDVRNDEVINAFFLGRDLDAAVQIPWSAWAEPLSLWAIYLVPLFVGVLMLSVLFARQWIVHEKLQFPIAAVMLEMVRDAPEGKRFNALFTDRRLWVGAAIAMGIHFLNGMHAYIEQIPTIPLRFNLSSVFTEGIWAFLPSYMANGAVYFSMVGIAFLMATEVSLSMWVVLAIYGGIGAFAMSMGVDPWESMKSQSYGATLAMGIYLLYLARSHLRRAVAAAFRSPRDEQERQYRGYRWIVRVFLLCTVIAVGWLRFTGMSYPTAIAQVVILYLVFLVMSRLVAETGLFFISPRFAAHELFQTLAPNFLSLKNNALAINSIWPIFYIRETLMPYAFNALRLTHVEREESGSLVAEQRESLAARPSVILAFIAAILLSILAAGWISIYLYYDRGAMRANVLAVDAVMGQPMRQMSDYARQLPPPPGKGPEHMAIGAALIVILGFCRTRFARWPLVPIALCMATSNALGEMWVSILIGWACKFATMRVGGVTVYSRIRPFFLGLIIGEVLIAGIWMLVGAVVAMYGYEVVRIRILPS
jgi:hypothetical protein